MDPLSRIFLWFVANWYWFVGAAFSFLVALGFLRFLSGFMLGLNQIFYIDGHEEHVNHARENVVYGFFLILNFFIIWVLFKMVMTVVGLDTANLGLGFVILLGYGLLFGLWKLYNWVYKKANLK